MATRSGERADYASTRPQADGAIIACVRDGSPAWEAGLEPGMRVVSVEGRPLRDIIDWRWEADGEVCDLVVVDPADGLEYEATLVREGGQDWGVEFTDVLFDGIRTCVNACQFCFMSMLPKEARSSLTLRDDDYRLSFLQGNFVTLTNLTDEDVERIIDYRLEPMNVSIHAVSEHVRTSLIGRRAMRGIEVLERLLEAGIEVHGQIVVCPDINDGVELERTLAWVEERPLITSLALVPLGYTKYSKRFSRSFSDDVEASRAVVRLVEPFQARARKRFGITRFQLSDEFYLAAHIEVPPAAAYDGYPQFYDGIGMLRSFMDETEGVALSRRDELMSTASTLGARGLSVLFVCGEAARGVFQGLADAWGGPVSVFSVRNDYFGGDVNVTGLICACDLLAQLPADLTRTLVVLPEPMFNFDAVTLDGVSRASIADKIEMRGGTLVVSACSPHALVDAVAAAVCR